MINKNLPFKIQVRGVLREDQNTISLHVPAAELFSVRGNIIDYEKMTKNVLTMAIFERNAEMLKVVISRISCWTK